MVLIFHMDKFCQDLNSKPIQWNCTFSFWLIIWWLLMITCSVGISACKCREQLPLHSQQCMFNANFPWKSLNTTIVSFSFLATFCQVGSCKCTHIALSLLHIAVSLLRNVTLFTDELNWFPWCWYFFLVLDMETWILFF